MMNLESYSHPPKPWGLKGFQIAPTLAIGEHASQAIGANPSLLEKINWLHVTDKDAARPTCKWQDNVVKKPAYQDPCINLDDIEKATLPVRTSSLEPLHYVGKDALIPGLPEDVAKLILGLVHREDLPSLCRVTKAWQKVIRSSEFFHIRKDVGTLEEWLYCLTPTQGCTTQWEVLNPDKGEWKQLPLMPGLGKVGSGVVVVNGKLLVIGGLLQTAGPEVTASAEVFIYDPLLNGWIKAASMHFPRYEFACGVLGNLVYVVGGHGTGKECLSSVEIYDPENNSWADLQSLRRARWGCFACGIEGKLFVMGGRSSYTLGSSRSIDVYDPSTKKWSEVKNGCSMVLAHTVVNGKVFCMEWKNERELAVYSPAEKTWSRISLPLPSSLRVDFCLSSFRNKLFLFSSTYCPPMYQTLVYDPNAEKGSQWSTSPIKPPGMCICCASIIA